jgi:hypothetical protein
MSQTVTLTRQGGNPTFSSLIVDGPTTLSGSLYTRSNLNVSGSIFTSGSLVVSGSIIAQSLVINTTIYSSGSNIFGNSPSNTQVFTGSMYVGGLISGSVFYGSGANLIGTATSLNIGGNAATATAVVATVTGTNSTELVRGNMADNDQFRILVGGTATNAGYVEIATADDGTEPIYVRQYTGVFSSLTRTATLLDGSGNTSFPGNVQLGASQNRPVQYDSNGGNFRITANAGGWATGYFFNGSSGTYRGGFGGFGNANDLTYYWIGGDYNAATMYITSGSNGSVGIGTSSPAYTLDVTGTGRFTGNISAANLSGTNTGDQTNISGNAATATTAVNLSGLGTIQSTSTGTSYTVNYQIRENSGGIGNTNEIYAPQLAFHWGGVVASSIMMEASGRIAIRNNPGTSYENFIANVIYANSSFQGNLTGNVTGDVSGNSATTSQRTFSNVKTDGISRGSYGAISIAGSTNTYSGIDFGAASTTFMVRTSDGLSGMYKNDNAWIWYFDGSGVLTVGTVPGGSVSGTVASATSAGNSTTTSQRSFSGDFSISGTSNTPLSINATEPYMNIVANGGSNVAGVRIYPTTNYDAYIGNYGGAGKLWLIAGNADNAYVDGSGGSIFNRSGTYGTISDITLKENIINATPKLQDLLKLKVRNFNFIGKNEKQLGFIAQEFEEVFPNAVNTDTGFGDMNGKKVVKTTVLIPMLVKAIQEQQTLITELQEKLERNNIT